jgi:hypothetical protein
MNYFLHPRERALNYNSANQTPLCSSLLASGSKVIKFPLTNPRYCIFLKPKSLTFNSQKKNHSSFGASKPEVQKFSKNDPDAAADNQNCC